MKYLSTIAKSMLIAVSLMGVSAVSLADNDYDDDDRYERRVQQSAKISVARAKQIAINSVGKGARIKSIDFDNDGRPHYDVEVIKNRTEYDISVDARSGAIIKKRVDY